MYDDDEFFEAVNDYETPWEDMADIEADFQWTQQQFADDDDSGWV